MFYDPLYFFCRNGLNMVGAGTVHGELRDAIFVHDHLQCHTWRAKRRAGKPSFSVDISGRALSNCDHNSFQLSTSTGTYCVFVQILMESPNSAAANRFRSGMKEITVAPGGSASFVYVIIARDGVGRWQLTGQG